MSTKLGTLTLDLIAKIGGFTGPIRDAERQTQTSFDKMRKHVNSYGSVAIAGAAAVGAGVLAMANEYANAARELQTFASISNTTTQEFQKMAVGAETMGISSEKLADQLKDFNEKLGLVESFKNRESVKLQLKDLIKILEENSNSVDLDTLKKIKTIIDEEVY